MYMYVERERENDNNNNNNNNTYKNTYVCIYIYIYESALRIDSRKKCCLTWLQNMYAYPAKHDFTVVNVVLSIYIYIYI